MIPWCNSGVDDGGMWYLLDLGLNHEKMIMATCTPGGMMGMDGCMILLQIFLQDGHGCM